MTIQDLSTNDPVGWPFLPLPEGGRLSFPSLEQSVRDAIRTILSTRQGEQLMRPRFGVGLQEFLDSENTIAARASIQAAILQGLQRYENRIVVDRVDVDPIDGAPAEIQVLIHYRLLRTNSARQIGVTLQTG
jgi:uncharacterized protein